MQQWYSNREMVLSVARAATVAVQRLGKHASKTIEELCFLRGPCREVISKMIFITESVDAQAVKRRLGGWREMAASQLEECSV
jgi:glucose-6-phosphate dehydrogenase assembly protein OpcA